MSVTLRRHALHRAFALADLATWLACAACALALVVLALGRARSDAGVQTSLNNLVTLGIAHAIYAADWNGRQFSNTVYDFSSYGSSAAQALAAYNAAHGGCSSANDPGCHPGLILGHGETPQQFNSTGGLFGYWLNHAGNLPMVQAMNFTPLYRGWGYFRIPNAQPLHDYVGGRFYDPTYYAPNDTEVYELAGTFFDDPAGYVPIDGSPTATPWWSSYCLSPAALLHPDVMRHPEAGGWQDPWSIDHAFETPPLWTALYPDLKTQLIEHQWNQNAPADRCNPGFEGGTYNGCEPYYFNHGLASTPATIFYDLSARLLPNAEALAADAQVLGQTGHGLWSRDTPAGDEGYFTDLSHDGIALSHHVYTTDGIHGRDTVAPSPAGPPGKTSDLLGGRRGPGHGN